MYLSMTTALWLACCVKTVIKISSTDSVFSNLATLRWIIQRDHNLLFKVLIYPLDFLQVFFFFKSIKKTKTLLLKMM